MIESLALLWFVPAGVSLCVQAACERGTLGTLTTDLGYDTFTCCTFFLCGTLVGVWVLKALKIQLQYFQSAVSLSEILKLPGDALTRVCFLAHRTSTKNNIVSNKNNAQLHLLALF